MLTNGRVLSVLIVLVPLVACSGLGSRDSATQSHDETASSTGLGQPCGPDGLCSADLICESALCKAIEGGTCGDNSDCSGGLSCYGTVCATAPDLSAPATILTGTVISATAGAPVSGMEISIEAVPGYAFETTIVVDGAYTFDRVELQGYDIVIAGQRFPIEVTTMPTQTAPTITLQ